MYTYYLPLPGVQQEIGAYQPRQEAAGGGEQHQPLALLARLGHRETLERRCQGAHPLARLEADPPASGQPLVSIAIVSIAGSPLQDGGLHSLILALALALTPSTNLALALALAQALAQALALALT